jgi:hypothetical protein
VSLFTIDVSALLSLPVGSISEFQFEQDIPDDTWEDLISTEVLAMSVKLIREEYGINCLLEKVSTLITIPSEGLEDISISLEHISREFHLKKTPKDTDDIEYINTHDVTIDLTRIVEQELLIAGL